jgi:UDP-glucose 4-epimerase
VVLDLLRAGVQVRVLDDLRNGHDAALRRVEGLTGRAVELVVADVADEAMLANALAGVDLVIHLAAYKDAAESMERPEIYFHNNVRSLAALLHGMERAGARRLIYSSSAAVYGPQERVPVPEDATLRPASPYGLSKRMGEEMVAAMAELRGWAAVSLRYFNPAGNDGSGAIGQPLRDAASLVPRALRALRTPGERLTVFGTDYPTADGSGERDYVHVSDLAAAHRHALSALTPGRHEVFNVGTGKGITVLQVLRACAEAAGREVPHTLGPRRPGDIPISVASVGRFRERTGFVAERGLTEMVRSAWRWCTEHAGGYGS